MSAGPPDDAAAAAPVLPDTPLVDEVFPSPNHGDRKGVRPDMLLLHYTGMAGYGAALARLRDPGPELSAHYLVREDGHITQLVPEYRRAHHAGAGSWAGANDVNSCSIGIEIANAGHDGGLPPYPEAQIGRVVALCRDILARHPIPPERILAHSDIAPDRKEDPGERFPWGTLHAAGIGLWVTPADIDAGASLGPGDADREVVDLQRAFAAYGYGLAASGLYDTRTGQVVTAFQRHFRPAKVDGIADSSTRETLRRLLDAMRAARVLPRPSGGPPPPLHG